VRTTEDMLLLVPDELREAGRALGVPRGMVIRSVAYKAAGAGIITGLLFAIARIAGETAPLLFASIKISSVSPPSLASSTKMRPNTPISLHRTKRL
jgi:ABC-type phosphate transport system permease subunit